MSKQYRQDSIKDILDELDKESASIVISKEIRGRHKKTSTVVRGIEHDSMEAEALTSELKTKKVQAAYTKKDKLFCKESIGRLSNSC